MANPFSGLENIGASYMAGARLAQERQRRADEILARQEEARIRNQYYQDIIDEREAARLATAGEREAQGATQFGKYLVRKPDGTIDYQASQAAKQVGEEEGQLGAAYGALAARGEDIGPISPRIMQTPQFMAAKVAGIDRREAAAKSIKDSMIRAGLFPVAEKPAPAFGLTPDLLREPEDTSQDVIVEGVRFRPTPFTRYKMQPKPVVEKPTVTITTKDGDREVRRELTASQAAAEDAKTAAAAPKELDPVDEAEKQLRDLQINSDTKAFNLERGEGGKLSVVPAGFFSTGLSAKQIMDDLKRERTKRAERKRMIDQGEEPSSVAPARKAGAPQRVPVNQQVIDVQSIQGLPPLRGR